MPRGQVALRLWSGRGDHLAVFAGLPDAERWADEAGIEERAKGWVPGCFCRTASTLVWERLNSLRRKAAYSPR